MTNSRSYRGGRQRGLAFATAVYCLGVAIVITFLLWTLAMVFFQAWNVWRH